jgi:hypothetical protein
MVIDLHTRIESNDSTVNIARGIIYVSVLDGGVE